MSSNILLYSGLLIAYINIYFSIKKLFENKKFHGKITASNLAVISGLSAIIFPIIYRKISYIGEISVFISLLTTVMIFFISISIIQDEEAKEPLGEK